MRDVDRDLDAIEAALLALHHSTLQHRAWEQIQAKAGVKLERANAALLKAVLRHGNQPCRMQDIAQQLGVEAPSVTRTVQELERDKLVRRQPDPQDRRVSHVVVTAAGKARMAKLHRARRQQMSQALGNWSASDRQQLARLLQRLADALGPN